MIKVILGEKGIGKTKTMVDIINTSSAIEKGHVVCITKGQRLLFDLDHSIRLIDTTEYELNSYEAFYGFVCGVISEDFDISHVFIESINKIINPDLNQFAEFINNLDKLEKKESIDFTITITADKSSAPASLLKFCVNE